MLPGEGICTHHRSAPWNLTRKSQGLVTSRILLSSYNRSWPWLLSFIPLFSISSASSSTSSFIARVRKLLLRIMSVVNQIITYMYVNVLIKEERLPLSAFLQCSKIMLIIVRNQSIHHWYEFVSNFDAPWPGILLLDHWYWSRSFQWNASLDSRSQARLFSFSRSQLENDIDVILSITYTTDRYMRHMFIRLKSKSYIIYRTTKF